MFFHSAAQEMTALWKNIKACIPIKAKRKEVANG
jgi:hypothetical protein